MQDSGKVFGYEGYSFQSFVQNKNFLKSGYCLSVCLSVLPISSETVTPNDTEFGRKVRTVNLLACVSNIVVRRL